MSVIAKSSLRSLISIRSTFSGGLILKARALTSSFFLAQGAEKPYFKCLPQLLSTILHSPALHRELDVRRQTKFSSRAKNQDAQSAEKPTLVQRFKQAYKVYGKVLIVVHGITSAAWLGAFYCVALTGFNILEVLMALHAPDWMLQPLRSAGETVGLWATALVLYKIAAPLRYGLTVWLTPVTVRALRARGKVPPLAEEDRLRNLARQGARESRERMSRRLATSRRRLGR